MTIKTTRWNPDTCGCVIEYQWDDTVPQDQRVHTPVNIVSQCNVHGSFNAPSDLYNHVLFDSQRKNLLFAILQGLNPNLTLDQYNAGVWSFTTRSPDIHGHVRQLIINSAQAWPAGQASTIQSSADAAFGAGETVIQ